MPLNCCEWHCFDGALHCRLMLQCPRCKYIRSARHKYLCDVESEHGCYAMLYQAMLCYAMKCYAMFCYSMPLEPLGDSGVHKETELAHVTWR